MTPESGDGMHGADPEVGGSSVGTSGAGSRAWADRA